MILITEIHRHAAEGRATPSRGWVIQSTVASARSARSTEHRHRRSWYGRPTVQLEREENWAPRYFQANVYEFATASTAFSSSSG